MNEKAIFDIGNLICVRHKFKGFAIVKLSASEILKTFEYKKFKSKYPNLCNLAERGISDES